MTVEIRQLSRAQAWLHREELASIYAAAFGYEKEQAGQFRERSLVHVKDYHGALVLVACAGERIVGFLYGYTYQPDHWWPMHVGPALTEAGYAHLLEDAFELVELEILPDYQGYGIGTRLVSELMQSTPHNHILLNTLAAPQNRAVAFYKRLGFRTLIPDFQYMEYGDENAIMAWSHPS